MPPLPENMTIVTVPCLSDNYAFLIHNSTTGQTALIDAPEAAPIQAELDARGWTLTDVLLTHHHWDHVDALPDLRGTARVIGAGADAHRLPPLDLAVQEGSGFTLCGTDVQVFDVSGHTVGHIAFYMADLSAAFTADSLMALGCGRLFEGTPAQMWESMKKLRALPGDTIIHSGHEYASTNAKFALTVEPDNTDLVARAADITAARAAGRPTVPTTLALETRTNPFLRADVDALQNAVDMPGADPVEVFTHVRKLRDNF